MKEKHGELINIQWNYDDAYETHFIRGHVTIDEASAKDSGAMLMKIMVNQSQAKWIEDGLGVLPPYFEVYQPMPLLHGEIGRFEGFKIRIGRFEGFKIRTMADPAPDRLLGSTLAPIPPHRLKYPCAPRSRGV